MKHEHGYIELASGTMFDVNNPNIDNLHIDDIAHSLSNICRFNGHCKDFYSVAQHSVVVSDWVSVILSKVATLEVEWKRQCLLGALLHDAAESITTDVPRPLKHLANQLMGKEVEIYDLIFRKFGVRPDAYMLAVIRGADDQVLAAEAFHLMTSKGLAWTNRTAPAAVKISPMYPLEARALFLTRFMQLQYPS